MTQAFYESIFARLIELGCQRAARWRGEYDQVQGYPAAYVEVRDNETVNYGNRQLYRLQLRIHLVQQDVSNEDTMHTPTAAAGYRHYTDRLRTEGIRNTIAKGLNHWEHSGGNTLGLTGQDEQLDEGQYIISLLDYSTTLLDCN